MERKELRSARLGKYWTLAQAAERLEVDLNTLSRWEQGKTRPHGYNIAKLCQVYGKTAVELGLETVQEETEEENCLLVAPLSLPVLPAATPPQDVRAIPPVEASDQRTVLTPSLPPDPPPVVPSHALQSQQRSLRRFRGPWRPLLLLVLLFLIAMGGAVGDSIMHGPARKLEQRPSAHIAGTTALPSPTRRTVQEGGTSPLPTRTAPRNTPIPPPSTPGITPGSTPSMPVGVREPSETPTPDCLDGSASRLTFTSVLGLGNPPSKGLTLTNCGGPTQNWSAIVATQSGGNWLSTSPSTGMIVANGSENVQIQAVGIGLQVGIYKGSILFTKGAASWSVTVTFTIVQV